MNSLHKASRRDWFALAVIALPCMVYAMDLTVLNLAIPAITADLKPSASQMLWIIDIYGFMVAGFLITMGTLGDKLGRRKVLLFGAALFALASAWAAHARTTHELIALRALLGVAGATLAPSTLSLISNIFRDEAERRLALGIWIASFSVGAVIGPMVGGIVLHYFAWQAVFWLAVPVMVLLLLLGPALLPEFKDPKAGAIDPASVLLSLLSVLSVVYAFKRWAEGQGDAIAASTLLMGVICAALFTRRQRHIAYPLLDTELFRQRRFNAALGIYALTSFAMFGIYVVLGQYLQLSLGLRPLMAGLATVPWALAFALGSLATAGLARRFTPHRVMLGGLGLCAAGFLLLCAAAQADGLWVSVTAMVLIALGMAPVFTLGNEIVITSAPPERAGAASSLSETSAELSGALGIALFGGFASALYRADLEPAFRAATLPVAGDAAATLGGTLTLAATLAPGMSQIITAHAHEAFFHAMRITALLGAATVAAAWLLSARRMKN